MNMLTRRRWLTGAAGAVVAAVPAWAAAADAAAFKVQRVNLAEPPALPLTTMVGDARRLARELAVAAPLVLNFVFRIAGIIAHRNPPSAPARIISGKTSRLSVG